MNTLTMLNISNINKQLLEIQRNADKGTSTAEISGEGVVLLKNFSQGKTASGKPKFSGTLANMEEVKFNVWNNSRAYEYFEQLSVNTQPHAVQIKYTLSKYGLVINDIMAISGFNPDSFIYHKYSAKAKSSEFSAVLKESEISEKAVKIIRAVFHMDYNDKISRRLIREYAAYSHHDNCATGLLAHTTKCIQIYNGIKKHYPFLADTKTNDLIVISLAVHDIGKIFEMRDGVYQGFSFLTHRGLGFEHLLEYKPLIVELYNEEFFYMISSVLLQHHGEYGENPRTLYAKIVHMIDNMEAQLTSFDDLLQAEETTVDAAGKKIKFNNEYLNILSA